MMNAVVLLPMVSMNGLISVAPKAQFKPMLQHRHGLRDLEPGRDASQAVPEHWNVPQWSGMGHADNKGLSCLTRQSSSTSINNGP